MLIGLRETDDRIVSATFSALAVMVPILGASVVVGGERRKLFIEGRPKVRLNVVKKQLAWTKAAYSKAIQHYYSFKIF